MVLGAGADLYTHSYARLHAESAARLQLYQLLIKVGVFKA